MDIRRAVLEAPAIRGPYCVKSSGSIDLINLIGSRPLHQQSFDYAQSEIGLNRTCGWRDDGTPLPPPAALRGSQRCIRSHLRAPLSVALPSVAIDDAPSSASVPPMLSAVSFGNGSTVPHGPVSPFVGTTFLQGKRHHHGHYFSNLDLFTSSTTYNYLRYAKADELQTIVGKQPHLQLKCLGFEVDQRTKFQVAVSRTPKYRRVLNGISLEAFGGETVAIMYTSSQFLIF